VNIKARRDLGAKEHTAYFLIDSEIIELISEDPIFAP